MLHLNSFFDSSTLREFFIGSSAILVALMMEIVGVLFYRMFQFRKSSKITWKIYMALAVLFTGYTVGFIALTITRLFILTDSHVLNQILYILAWIFIGLGGFGACVIIEKSYQDVFSTYYLFSALSCFSTFITIYGWNHLERPVFSYSGLISFLLINLYMFIFLTFLYYHGTKELRVYLRFIIIGFIIFIQNLLFFHNAFAWIINSNIFASLLYLSQIIGALFLFYGFIKIPTFNDADWRENMSELYIIEDTSKKILFYHHFKHPTTKPKKTFPKYFGGIESVLDLISNTDHHRIEKIEQENSLLIIEQMENCVGILDVRSNYPIYSQILEQILKFFMNLYAEQKNSLYLRSEVNKFLLRIIK